MARIGIFLIVIGFGSLVLNAFDYEFVILSWATPYQPLMGIGIGIIGVAVTLISFLLGRQSAES
jgi:hypothetical protein